VEGQGQLHDLDPNRKIDWDAVRVVVESGKMTRIGICRRFGVSRAEIARRIKANRWDAPERDDAQDRSLLLDGLSWALEQQIDQLGVLKLADPVKEAAVLHRLASTLETIVKLGDKASVVGQRTPRQSKELAELKLKIARRLDELNIQ
jgi:hypothetical protein